MKEMTNMKPAKALDDYWWGHLCFPLLLIAIAIISYSNSLGGAFVWDDRAAIISNADVRGSTPISDLFMHDFWGQNIRDTKSHKSYRPLTVLSFRIDHSIHDFDAFGYHLTSVAIYCLTCVAMYYTCYLWLAPTSSKLAALFFVVHPVHVEAVTSLVGRADNLCGLFYFSAMILYTVSVREASSFRWYYFALSLFSALMASLSKEIGLTVFAVLIVLEVLEALRISLISSKYFKLAKKDSGGQRRWAGYLTKRSFKISCEIIYNSIRFMLQDNTRTIKPLVCIMLIFMFFMFRSWLHGEHALYSWTVLENHIDSLPSFSSRLLSYAQTHLWYSIKLLYPKYLCFDYGYSCIPTILSIWDDRNLLPLLLYTTLLFSIYRIVLNMQTTRMLGFVSLFLPLLPALNIFLPVGTLLAERLLFVPSMGFCVLIAEVLVEDCAFIWQELYRLVKHFSPENMKTSNIYLREMLLIPLVIFSVIHVRERNLDWYSEKNLYSSSLNVCPTSIKALANFAVYSANSFTTLSRDSALKALHLYPQHSSAAGNAGLASMKLDDYARGAALLEYAFYIDNSAVKVPGYLAQVFFGWSGKFPKDSQRGQALRKLSTELITSEVNFDSQPPSALHIAGTVALEAGDYSKALELYFAAINQSTKLRERRGFSKHVPIEDDIRFCYTYNQIAAVYKALNQFEQALRILEEGLIADPDCEPIITNIAALYKDMGLASRGKKILHPFVEAMAFNCTAALLNNYGSMLEDIGEYSQALKYFEKALEKVEEMKKVVVDFKYEFDYEFAKKIIMSNIDHVREKIIQ